MKIKYEDKQSRLVGEIKIGTVFSGAIYENTSDFLLVNTDSTFLRIGGGIVDLQDPNYVRFDPDIKVHDYEELDAELVIKGVDSYLKLPAMTTSQRGQLSAIFEGMKVRYEKKEEQAGRKLIRNIAVGAVFSGTIGSQKGVFAKTYDRIVLLENMRDTWNIPPDDIEGRGDLFIGLKYIYNYKKLDVELLVKGEAK